MGGSAKIPGGQFDPPPPVSLSKGLVPHRARTVQQHPQSIGIDGRNINLDAGRAPGKRFLEHAHWLIACPTPWPSSDRPRPNGPQVVLWFDVGDYTAGLVASRRATALCLNLVLMLPLQLLLHVLFAKSESSWAIPGLETLPFPEPPEWYQQLVSLCLWAERTSLICEQGSPSNSGILFFN